MGIVHRDLKPENLFLSRAEDRAPMVKILDFGIVKMIEDGPGATGSGQLLGTPKYMAPEQVSTQRRVTSATDRCSLGLVAYRLLTGESYYRGDVLSVLAQVLHAPLEPPSQRHPGFSGAFDAWFLRACHRDPDARFASAFEQIEELSAAMGLPTVAIREAPIGDDGSSPWRRKIVAAVLVAGGVAGATLAGVLLSRRPRSSRSGATTTSVSHEAPPPPSAPALSPPGAFRPPPPERPAGTQSAAARSARGSGKSRAPPRRPPDTRSVAGTAPAAEAPKAADPYADQK
jgi:serine/threonine protein kinase